MAEPGSGRVRELLAQGQSIWLDYISREMVAGGGLRRLVEEVGVRGETSNPSIFEKAIGGGDAYDAQLRDLARKGLDAEAIYDRIAVADVQAACDVFRPLYDSTGGADGYVSIEVSPRAAYDADLSIAEAHRLWEAVGRPNVMIKIPGTAEGIPAVRRCLADGININITLLFSLAQYTAVVEAFMQALEDRAARGQGVASIASVASFFVSRVDTVCDRLIEERLGEVVDARQRQLLEELRGRVGVANSRVVYERFSALVSSPRWQRLAALGARRQRVLWASTGTKNPSYSDVLYVDQLIGSDTVNTVPEATLRAFLDHGRVQRTVDADVEQAHADLAALAEVGIDLDRETEELQREGVRLFTKAHDGAVQSVEAKRVRFAAEQE